MSVDPGRPVSVMFVLFLSFEAFLSIFMNIFITSVILRDYYLKRYLKSVQKIQAALTASSTFFTVVFSFDVSSTILLPDFSGTLSYNIVLSFLLIYCLCSSSSLTAVLCLHYFLKVVTVQSGFLGWVKEKLSSIGPWQIVVVKSSSLINSLLSLFLYTPDKLPSMNSSFILDTSGTLKQTGINYNIAKLLLIMVFMPILCTVLTTLLTVGFLTRHSHRMKNAQTSGGAGLTLYERVVSKMMRFLMLYSLFYLVIFLYYFSVFVPLSPGYWINLMLMFLFAPIQSALHILDNHNLRSRWKEMIGCIMCWLDSP